MAAHPTILRSDGKPTHVVLAYEDYMRLVKPAPVSAQIPMDGTVPHDVVRTMVLNDWSIVRAWRSYLNITQVEMARRLGVRQPTYRAMEEKGSEALRLSTRNRIAEALGVQPEQLVMPEDHDSPA